MVPTYNDNEVVSLRKWAQVMARRFNGSSDYLLTGRAFSQGILPGTIARVQEALMVVGQDMVAYRIAGAPERISHHGIEEKIRTWQESL